MELSHQLHQRRAVLRADWIPRLQNEEADALTNMDFRHFDPEKRISVTLAELRFGVLNDLLSTGQEYYEEVEGMREAERTARRARGDRPAGRTRKKAGTALRDREPW